MLKKINFKLFLFFFIIINWYNLYSKDHNSKLNICADEVGPILEFTIPEFNEKPLTKFSFKIYKQEDRNSVIVMNGIIEKKSSPIDDTYFYYQAKSVLESEKSSIINFEFYPPSHLLIQRGNSPFNDLVCWRDNN